MAAVAEAAVLPRFRALTLADAQDKGGGDPVTVADLDAERALRAALPSIRDVPVVGEEGWDAGERARLAAGEAWIVDPLDGTRAFLAGDDRFAMIVALVEGGRVTAGWLSFPARGEVFAATEAHPTATRHSGGWRPCQVHPSPAPGRLRLGFLDPEDRARAEPPLRAAGWADDTPTCWELRRLLSGEPGGYLCTHVTPWDMAAGVHLVTRAGGAVRRADGAAPGPSDEAGLYVFAPDAATADGWIERFGLGGAAPRSALEGPAT